VNRPRAVEDQDLSALFGAPSIDRLVLVKIGQPRRTLPCRFGEGAVDGDVGVDARDGEGGGLDLEGEQEVEQR
jgi:hypothetical protein